MKWIIMKGRGILLKTVEWSATTEIVGSMKYNQNVETDKKWALFVTPPPLYSRFLVLQIIFIVYVVCVSKCFFLIAMFHVDYKLQLHAVHVLPSLTWCRPASRSTDRPNEPLTLLINF